MKGDTIYDFGGLKLRVLFSKVGYAPHYAEEVVDVDGARKLVMADPHLRQSVYVYNLERGIIEWEFQIPKGETANPHVAHLVTDTNPVIGPFWKYVVNKLNINYGDIVVPDRNNSILVIDRGNNVKSSVPTGANQLFDAVPSVDGEGLIITDQGLVGKKKRLNPGWIAKMNFSGGVLWKITLEKASRVTLL